MSTLVPFTGELDAAPKLVPFAGELDPTPDTTLSDQAMQSGDLSAMSTQATQDAPGTQPKVGSIFDNPAVRMDALTNDAAKNLDALQRARLNNPNIGDSPMYSSGAALEHANVQTALGQAQIDRAHAADVAQNGQSSGSMLQDAAVNLLAGAPRQTAKALAAGAQAFGADDVAQSLDSAANDWREVQKQNGANTVAGRAGDMVGSIIPVLLTSELLPAEAAYQTVANAGLFAIPAFRDTLKEKLDAGEQFPTALAHASQSFGINLFLPDIAAKGGALAKVATRQGGIVGGALATGVEGAGFSAANSVLDKGTDLAFGAAPNQQDPVAKKNVNDWVNLQDMAESAIGFGAVKGLHAAAGAVGQGASAILDRTGSASQQFGRALGQDVDAAQFDTRNPVATLNPNLADVPAPRTPAVDVSPILSATSVDEAIAAAQSVASVSDESIRAQMEAIRPTRPTLEQDLAALEQRKADAGRVDDIPPVVAGADGAAAAAVDAGGVRPAAAGDAVPLEPGRVDAVAPREISGDEARAIVAGKTEKPGGVNPVQMLNAAEDNGKRFVLGPVRLADIRANEEGDRYDGTVNAARAQDYAARPAADAPPVLLVRSRRTGELNVLDGGHRVTAARLRGDDSIPAIIMERSEPAKVDATPAPEAADTAPVAPAPIPDLTPKEQRAIEGDPFRTFLMRQGVALKLAQDFAPGTRERLAMGRTFRKNGLDLDALAEHAAEQGFIKDPSDTDALYDMIGRAVSGEKIHPIYGEDGALSLRARVEEHRQREKEDAELSTAGLSDETLHAFNDDDVPWDTVGSNVTTADAMRSLGFNEEEIAHATAQESERAQGTGTGDRASVEAAAADAQGRDREREGQAPGQQERDGLSSTRPRDVAESDQDRSHREWAENYDRVAAADDLSTISPLAIERAINYADSRRNSEARKGWKGEPVNHDFIEALDREIENLKFHLRTRREEAGLSRPSADDVVAQQARAQAGERDAARTRAEHEARAKADADLPDFGLQGSDRPADANPDQGTMFRRSPQAQGGLSEPQFRQHLEAAFGAGVAQRLIDKGVVVPLADQSRLPSHVVPFVRDGDRIFGFHDKRTDRTYAVLSNLDHSMVKGLVLHEVGVHYGFKAMLGQAKYDQVINRLAVMGRAGHAGVVEAHANAKENAAHSSHVPEETLAYLVTNHPELGVVREVIARIKAFLYREFGIGGKYLSADDMTALARAAVLHASRFEAGEHTPEFARAASFAREGDARTIEVDGQRRPVEDSVGKPIAADHDTGKLRAFYRWFGESKAADADGHPLVVYHGSPDARFMDEDGIFATMKDRMQKFGNTPESLKAADAERGFFFTTSRGVAETYANPKRAFDYQNSEPAVIPTYLSVKNPLEFDAKGLHWREAQKRISKDDFIKQAKDAGHDGVVIRNVRDSYDSLHTGRDPLSDVWVAFDSRQIKHAERNAGTYDRENPDVRFSRSDTLHDITRQGYEVPTVQAGRRLRTMLEKYDQGKLTQPELELKLRFLADDMSGAAQIRQMKADSAERVRGPDWVRERLLRARRTGEIDGGAADFALWALDQNPSIAEGLGLSIRTPKGDGMTSGHYNPSERVATLMKDKAGEDTAVHEIMHHTERMMPPEVQKGIAAEWSRQMGQAMKSAEGPRKEALADMLRAMAGDDEAHKNVREAFKSGVLEYERDYPLTNPSEFWAVNATRILRDRAETDGWVGKAKQWLGEFVQKAKGWFGLSSDAPVLKGLQAVMSGDGEFASKRMLANVKDYAQIAQEKPAEDPSFSRSKTADADLPDEVQERPPVKLPGHGAITAARGFMDEIYKALAPMSAGDNQQAKATAQQFANNLRTARFQWERMSDLLKKTFTPEERAQMWSAAEEQNALMLRGEDATGKGLDTLTPSQRAALDSLHDYSRELWARAKAVGMVEGEGLPYWTPRMAALLVDGQYVKPTDPGKKATADGVGRNVFTTAPSAKQRKHADLSDSEAALKGALGDNAGYVKDILTMPLAMSRFEQAIAGRELINTIKDIGTATGEDLVNHTGGPGFFTLDHPAFTVARPRFTTDAETGKKVAAVNQNGDMQFDRQPIFIRQDFEGPLKAVLSTKNPALYSGYMLLKSKAMSAIMYSPLVHNQVIFGRALAYSKLIDGGPLKTVSLYFSGHAAKADLPFMRQMTDAGMVPIGDRHNMLDVSDIANGEFKESGWTDPNESWLSLAAKKIGNAAHEGLGDGVKRGLDAAGDLWHNTLLWRRVGDLQAGIARDAYDSLVAKGFSPEVASVAAAHLANRYAGALGQENMSKVARMAGNVGLFSLSFNAGNVGTVKDTAFGTTEGLRALIRERADSKQQAEQILSVLKNKARWGLVKDLAYSVIAMNLANLWFQRDKDADWSGESLGRGLSKEAAIAMKAYMNLKAHPTDLSSWDPRRLTGSYDNEPGKENRIFMGNQENGRGEYLRLPTGKVVEDLIGWTMHPGNTMDAKQAPFVRAALGLKNNRKDDFGTPVWDERDPSVLHKIADAAKFVLSTQVPVDQARTLYDMANGHGSPMDREKMVGNVSGFTVSQGHPAGPEGGVAADVERQVQASKLHAMGEVRELLKYGKADEAFTVLEQSGLTPKEINAIIRRIDNPKSGISAATMKRFNSHANEADQGRMQEVTH